MDETVFDEVIDELFSSLESLETQTRALTAFLQEKGPISGEEFEPYVRQAAETASVRWRAGRIRMKSLLSSALKSAAESVSTQAEKAARDKNETPQKPTSDKPHEAGTQAAAENGSAQAKLSAGINTNPDAQEGETKAEMKAEQPKPIQPPADVNSGKSENMKPQSDVSPSGDQAATDSPKNTVGNESKNPEAA
jgi:hypothetical protein